MRQVLPLFTFMFCEIPPKPPGWGPKALKAIKAIRLALLDDSPISMTVVVSPTGDGQGATRAQTAPTTTRRLGVGLIAEYIHPCSQPR